MPEDYNIRISGQMCQKGRSLIENDTLKGRASDWTKCNARRWLGIFDLNMINYSPNACLLSGGVVRLVRNTGAASGKVVT